MSTELITYQDAQSLAETFAKSGYFADARDMAQAMVKIMAGRELGIGPVASMSGVYIVKGKPSLSANLLAGVLKKSGKYDYRVITLTETECEIAFFQSGKEIGRSLFTMADAKKAGTQNLDKFARNMLFARAMTNGCRWYCPDVFAGGIYTPEELGAETDGETGEMVNITPTVTEIVKKMPEPLKASEVVGPDFDRPAAPPSDKMWAKYRNLAEQARTLGIDPGILKETVTAFELGEAGKTLRQLVNAATGELETAKMNGQTEEA